VQIPILNGIYTDAGANFRTSYPVNLVPIAKEQGISKGYLRPGDGLVASGTGPGIDRGGIEWQGVLYRVMGTSLVSITVGGVATTLGDVGGSGYVTFDYSFTLLAIASGGKLFYWDGATLTQVTDPDLGTVLDVVWVDGYFMTTDGESLVVTELTDPFAVNPLKYGSSEADPDPVVALLKLRNEVFALNRNTVEVFNNVVGTLFPFARIEGAQIQKGVVGTFACCVFAETIAFLGGGRNEPTGIFLGVNATANRVSTEEIDTLLSGYSAASLAEVKLEARIDRGRQLLYVHLPDRALVYDAVSSQLVGEPVWFVLSSSAAGFSEYRGRNFVWAFDRWNVGDPLSTAIGYTTEASGAHWGDKVRWEFGTTIIYNASKSAIFHELELVALTGRVAVGTDPAITTSYSVDGQAWSQSKRITVGATGDRLKRLVWWQQGFMQNWRVQRFQGDSDAHVSFARLEARLEPLAN
jgi:hypothetical protein